MNVRDLFRWLLPRSVPAELEQQSEFVKRQTQEVVGELDRITEKENPMTGVKDPLANLVHAMRNEQLRRGFSPENGDK